MYFTGNVCCLAIGWSAAVCEHQTPVLAQVRPARMLPCTAWTLNQGILKGDGRAVLATGTRTIHELSDSTTVLSDKRAFSKAACLQAGWQLLFAADYARLSLAGCHCILINVNKKESRWFEAGLCVPS